jgi:tetratricopeptide (TPR) repeat protein
VDPPDADVHHADAVRDPFLLEALRDDHAEAVVPAQDVPDSGDEHPHVDHHTGVIDELEQRLARYPAERYPVQHATAQFHLGVALTNARAPEAGMRALERAVVLFAEAGLRAERAKALNALGAALREVGDVEGAAGAFAEAADAFAEAQLPLEEGAARFNLGLVRRDPEALRRARGLFGEGRAAVQTAAAERELGAVLLEQGELDEAAVVLEQAAALSERAGDEAGTGAAVNALGLIRFAAGRTSEAIDLFRLAVGAHPRTVRPAEFAMAKANLALAYERGGDAPRARLAAKQALGVAEASPSVVSEAEGVLGRLGPVTEDLGLVLDAEPEERRATIVREEVVRWSDAAAPQRIADAECWIETQLTRPELAEIWLGSLLELPPGAMEDIIRSTLQALASRTPEDAERFRRDVVAATARFHVPQLERLRATFERVSAEIGWPASWS